jgi:hypothetical protein
VPAVLVLVSLAALARYRLDERAVEAAARSGAARTGAARNEHQDDQPHTNPAQEDEA